jgi:metal-responsive CopG/Arc/MetJ family transcriptional regulator
VGTKKIAISMPEPMFREMESARKRRAADRSVWVQEAIAERLKREQHEADIAAYVRSYDERPELDWEREWVEAAQQVGPVFDDEWPEAPG